MKFTIKCPRWWCRKKIRVLVVTKDDMKKPQFEERKFNMVIYDDVDGKEKHND